MAATRELGVSNNAVHIPMEMVKWVGGGLLSLVASAITIWTCLKNYRGQDGTKSGTETHTNRESHSETVNVFNMPAENSVAHNQHLDQLTLQAALFRQRYQLPGLQPPMNGMARPQRLPPPPPLMDLATREAQDCLNPRLEGRC